MIEYKYMYNQEFFGQELSIKHFNENKLGYTVLKNAIVLPFEEKSFAGGIVDENGVYIENTHVHNLSGRPYGFSEKDIKHNRERAIYIGMFQPIWGHCFTDNIRRCWFLSTDEYKEKYSDYDLIYIPMENRNYSEGFLKILSILGADFEKLVPITELTKYKEIVLPDESFYTLDGNTRYFTKEYVDSIDKIKSYAKSKFTKLGFNKVYFTYSGYNKGKSSSEKKLDIFFKQQGYRVIAPEKCSFDEQLNILANCTHFASTIGSCSHNIIFLPEGTNIILIPRAWYLTGYQLALNECYNYNIKFVDSSLSICTKCKNPWSGPFFYIISDKLLECFDMDKDQSEKFWKESLDGLATHFIYSILKRFRNMQDIPDYYKKEFLLYAQRQYSINSMNRVLFWLIKNVLKVNY